MSEQFSPLERDLVKTNQENFRRTVETMAAHSESILLETGERDGEPYTDMMLFLREGSHSPSSLREMKINLGLDSEVVAVVTPESNAIIVTTPLSIGKMHEVFAANPPDSKVAAEINAVSEQASNRQTSQIRDISDGINQTFQAALGETRHGSQNV